MAGQTIQCPSCGQSYNLTSEYLAKYGGQVITCQKCSTDIQLPSAMGQPGASAPRPVSQEPPRTQLSYATPRPAQAGWNWGDFFGFRRMITPLAIQVVFWLGVVGCLLGGIGIIIGSFNVPTGQTFTPSGRYGQPVVTTTTGFSAALFVTGLAWIVVGPIVVRIYCELLIVIFRISETLTDIKKDLEVRR